MSKQTSNFARVNNLISDCFETNFEIFTTEKEIAKDWKEQISLESYNNTSKNEKCLKFDLFINVAETDFLAQIIVKTRKVSTKNGLKVLFINFFRIIYNFNDYKWQN